MLFPWWRALARVRGGEPGAGLRELELIEDPLRLCACCQGSLLKPGDVS
jgi:hypothetical protein